MRPSPRAGIPPRPHRRRPHPRDQQELHAVDRRTQDHLPELCVGRDANIQRERARLAAVSGWRRLEVKRIVLVGDTSFAETSMDQVTTDGRAVDPEQVARAVQSDRRILAERPYHP